MTKRVLVVEDHEENRRIVRLLLASRGSRWPSGSART